MKTLNVDDEYMSEEPSFDYFGVYFSDCSEKGLKA